MKNIADFLIVGGGILGICMALELKKRYADQEIIILEKEERCGLHASGRNSGVIHAGFYYTADSLKAKFTRNGNIRLTQYCLEKGIPIRQCGKLVVAKDENDLPQFMELMARAEKNGVPLKEISKGEAQEIEPRVKTFERALFSPTTSSTDPEAVLRQLEWDAERVGVRFERGVRFLRREKQEGGDQGAYVIRTTGAMYHAGYFINAAGLYADRVARQFGFSKHYRILPFKGLYLYSREAPGAFQTNIYPVPDLRNPFLGVHFTVKGDGRAKIGPTAIPAVWREQYKGMENFQWDEFLEIAIRGLGLLIHSEFDFKRLAVEELRKYSRKRLVQLAQSLAKGVKVEDYRQWGPAGIRAQLLDVRKRKLEMDFVVEGDHRSLHILNAVSPGWTCAHPFSEYLCDQIESRQS